LGLIAKAVAFKASIVGRDERDMSLRLQLNYGHTFAHAIETSLGYKHLLHGEAVLIGILGALYLADSLGISNANELADYRILVRNCVQRLPKRRLDTDAIVDAMGHDKKRFGRGATFVLLKRPGQAVFIKNPLSRQVRTAIKSMIDQYWGNAHAPRARR
jgi:3-dehydroquinate synthase